MVKIKHIPKPLLREWDYKKNKTDPLLLKPFSHKKYWWICINNHKHVWQAELANKVQRYVKSNSIKKNGCPWCSKANTKVTSFYNLKVYLTENKKIDLIKKFSKNNKIHIEKIKPGDNKKFYWDCAQCKTPFLARPRDIYRNDRRQVKHCSNCKYITRGETFSKLSINKSGSILDSNPKIKEIWDYNKNKKGPENYARYSHSKVWFKCLYGHSYKGFVYHKTNTIGCPKCYSKGSKAEVRIYSELFNVYKNQIEWHKKIDNVEIDIFIKNFSIGIEVDGYPWHLNSKIKELKKNKFCEQKNITLIRIRDPKLPFIHSRSIISKLTDYNFDEFKKLVDLLYFLTKDKKLLEIYNKKDFSNEKLYQKFLTNLPKPFPGTSLGDLNKKLSKEFDVDKNYPLTPFDFAPKSNTNIWWLCEKGHSYKTTIGQRNRKNSIEKNKDGSIYKRRAGTGCPICSGRIASEDNNFEKSYPDLLKYFDSKKNKLKPKDFTPNSNKYAYWKCNNKHSWKLKIRDMVRRKKYKCNICKR